jgi:iron complex transport system substrate-binding protein
MASTDEPHRGRRALLAAGVAAPFAAAALLGRRPRGALVGARAFADGRAERGPFPKRLVDPAGQVRVLAAPPRRIVSTYLACEETLASLVDLERVVGVSAYADDPSTSNCFGVYPPRVARVRSEPERLLSLEPDLICVSPFAQLDSVRILAQAGPPLVRWSRFDSFAEIIEGVQLLGAVVGEEVKADAIAAGVEREIADVTRRVRGVAPLRVLYYDSPGYTMGAGTLVDEMITRAGGRNVAAEAGIRGPGEVGVEAVLALQPDAVLMPRYGDSDPVLARLGREPAWRSIAALARGRVHEVPSAWVSTASHHAARGLARVARVLHPEAFAR